MPRGSKYRARSRQRPRASWSSSVTRTIENWVHLMPDRKPLAALAEDGRAFDTYALRLDSSSDNVLQRAEGSCRIVVGGSEKGTRVMDVYQKSPLRVLFPRSPAAGAEEAVLVNT